MQVWPVQPANKASDWQNYCHFTCNIFTYVYGKIFLATYLLQLVIFTYKILIIACFILQQYKECLTIERHKHTYLTVPNVQ